MDKRVEENERRKLRDQFAGQALAGLLAQGAGADPVSIDMVPLDCTAHAAYALADAMLKAREG